MAIQTLNTIKNWFKTSLKPSQQQFWDTWDSFRHKLDKVPVKDVEGIDDLLNTKADKIALNDHIADINAHASLLELKEDKSQKGIAHGYAPLNNFTKLASQYLDIVNDLVSGGSSSLLSAEQGIILQNQIKNINTILISDNFDLSTFQQIANAVESIQTSLNTILVNDLTTGGSTKALTAEMGKLINDRLLKLELQSIPDLNAVNINLGSYPSTRNDGQLPTNKILSTDANGNIKLYTLAMAPAPYLEVLIPDSTLPSTTTNFSLKGAFFTPSMTIEIEGQTINYITFISDNLVKVNVTTGNTEGLFDVILNNGISATFTNALMIVLGTIYSPVTTDWISLSGSITAIDNRVETLSYTSVGSALWNKELDWNKNFEIRCKPRKTPLGLPVGYQYSFLQLINVSDNSNKLNLTWAYPGGYVQCRSFLNEEGYSDGITVFAETSLEAWNNYIENIEIKIRWLNGVFTLWHNGQLKKTFSSGLTQNLWLKASVYATDLYDIKYIELAV